MPKNLRDAIETSVEKAHPGENHKEVMAEVYATLNKEHAMDGPNETALGAQYEEKYNRDHGTKG